jgi:two-component system chemotaxis response regulator CheB
MAISPPSRGGPQSSAAPDPYRVLIVDDSAVIRGLLARILEAEDDITVVTTVSDGRMAIKSLGRHDIEVIVLDIEMPGMDGLTALPLLVAADPDVKIIMASTLTRKNAEISMRALAAGAHDYIPKPSARSELRTGESFKRDLVEKVKALGEVRRRSRPKAPARVRRAPRAPTTVQPLHPGPVTLRRPTAILGPKVLAIGSSTGGPQALFSLFKSLNGRIAVPVLITQHMPATFTAILAEHLARASGMKCAEAIDGEPLCGGQIYVAPGGFHMIVEAKDSENLVRLTTTPPESFCRPAVDPMLRSIAANFGALALVIILTGMGQDGLQGCKAVTDAGGTVVAQDQATSVVWGMPGAVAAAGLCSAVLPIAEIGPYVGNLSKRSAA